ncbi:MAG: hypothetical protein K2X93_13095 [Candidatus Obscuribacterales bacterium]|nr:hypothetical protein [Candidatus Obscuribacterales bacterium]
MSPLNIVLRIVAILLIFCVLIAIFAFVLKLAFLAISLIGVLLCLGVVYLVTKKLFFSKQREEDTSASTRDIKLWSPEGTIPLFQEEPQLTHLIERNSAQLPAKAVSVTAETEVSVLDESDIALRIKIRSGAHKGKVGWVDKASVVGYPKS